MKPRCIVFDCDEVLLDHIGGLSRFVKEHYDIQPITPYPDEYDLCKWLGGIPYSEVQWILHHFNHQSYEFGLLEPVENNTVDIVRELREKFSQEKFVVLTKCGKTGHGEVLRKVNLINAFGEDVFDDIIIIEMNESKKPALVKLQEVYDVKFMVDDYIKNIETSMELDIPSIMMRSSHNEMYKNGVGYTYVNNWTELRFHIYTLLAKYYQ